MRIISGYLRGRRLQPPMNLPVRPTTDFAKEGLFNVLNNLVDYESLSVLDLFTGTGSIAFEFISRGAVEVTCVDNNYQCIGFITKTSEKLGVGNLRAVKSNVFGFVSHSFKKYDLIFADPPYDLPEIDTIPDLILSGGLIDGSGLFILEHSSKYDFGLHDCFIQRRQYGSVNFSFFSGKGKSEQR